MSVTVRCMSQGTCYKRRGGSVVDAAIDYKICSDYRADLSEYPGQPKNKH
jgi:hypothetical protein